MKTKSEIEQGKALLYEKLKSNHYNDTIKVDIAKAIMILDWVLDTQGEAEKKLGLKIKNKGLL